MKRLQIEKTLMIKTVTRLHELNPNIEVTTHNIWINLDT
jgi:molybdopterin/thiamine biosynthesis adenylyltransferase